MVKIGFSACFFHADPKRAVFKGKTLQYLEQSIVHWVAREKVMAFMIPDLPLDAPVSLKDYVNDLDGLVLQGGSDVSPKSYGETALKPEWNGDEIRDRYEIRLVKEFLLQKKPVLGICRGAQLINVAMGGTLYQDIATQIPKARNHRDWEIYDQNFHAIRFEEGSLLRNLYPGLMECKVNTVHHQALKDLGKDLVVEAVSKEDGLIEAIRYLKEPFMYAVQWHPEFHDPHDQSVMDGKPLLREFLAQAKR